MEKTCDNCGAIIEGVDLKGDGVRLTWFCEECTPPPKVFVIPKEVLNKYLKIKEVSNER